MTFGLKAYAEGPYTQLADFDFAAVPEPEPELPEIIRSPEIVAGLGLYSGPWANIEWAGFLVAPEALRRGGSSDPPRGTSYVRPEDRYRRPQPTLSAARRAMIEASDQEVLEITLLSILDEVLNDEPD